jgi:parvulin-like peptidyl-prolyl isomerase
MQRFVLLAGTLIIVSVITLVGSGYYFTQYRPLHQITLKVNDKEFDMAYYVAALKFFGTGQDVTELLQQNELIWQAAEKLGITVSDDEAKEEVEKRKIPVSNTNVTFIKAELLANKLIDEYFDEKTPNSTVQRESIAMFLEDEKQAKEIKDRIVTGGEDFKKLASELSLDKTTKDAGGYLDWHPKGVLVTVVGSAVLDDCVFSAEVGALGEPIADTIKSKAVGYWVMKLVAREDDTANLMVILLPDETSAARARARLEAGEDFVTVGKEVSQMPGAKDNGGDLGFINKGERGDIFDDFAFNAAVADGALSQVIRDDEVTTRGGFWLVKVLAEDKDKLLSQTDRDALRNRLYYEWVSSLWADKDNKVESFITEEQKNWAREQSKKG